jgi:hypothetical protein
MTKHHDLTGLKFGRLTLLEKAGSTPSGQARWLCACDCGGTKIADASQIKRGRTSSCGCLALEQKRQAAQSQCSEYSRTNLYRERKTWENMLARCYNASHVSFKNYGAAGITVCDRWRDSFPAFAKDMGERPAGKTIDRIDGSKGYFLENCRWADKTEQANNRRTNHRIAIDGQTKTIAEWARHYGMSQFVIHSRLYQGWSVHDAVTLAVGTRRTHK